MTVIHSTNVELDVNLFEQLLEYSSDTGDAFGAFRVGTGDYTSTHAAECCGWLARRGFTLGDWAVDADGVAERRSR